MIIFPLFQFPDYDDDSGVYIGPGHAFDDDEDLEYLSKDDLDDEEAVLPPPPAQSTLVVEPVSGIYFGFDDVIGDFNDIKLDDKFEDAVIDETSVCDEERTKLDFDWKNPIFKSKRSGKYKVLTESRSEGNVLSRLLKKALGGKVDNSSSQ